MNKIILLQLTIITLAVCDESTIQIKIPGTPTPISSLFLTRIASYKEDKFAFDYKSNYSIQINQDVFSERISGNIKTSLNIFLSTVEINAQNNQWAYKLSTNASGITVRQGNGMYAILV